MTIDTLINKQDNAEIVRDMIGAILAAEVVSQMALAVAASEDPLLWKLRIYTERSNPWEQFLNNPTDTSPLVNVWWDNSNFEMAASNIVERQKATAIFNLDCYGYAVAADEAAGGHKPGDREAAFEAQRAVRLVRNILMAAEYTYLSLRGVVWRRWISGITNFQPPQEPTTVQQISGSRIAFQVEFNELSPQITEETLELLTVDVMRAEDGQLIVETDYDYM